MATKPYTVALTNRQVIENKILAALDGDDKVAILATKQDLEDFLFALERVVIAQPERRKRCISLAEGIRILLEKAFQ